MDVKFPCPLTLPTAKAGGTIVGLWRVHAALGGGKSAKAIGFYLMGSELQASTFAIAPELTSTKHPGIIHWDDFPGLTLSLYEIPLAPSFDPPEIPRGKVSTVYGKVQVSEDSPPVAQPHLIAGDVILMRLQAGLLAEGKSLAVWRWSSWHNSPVPVNAPAHATSEQPIKYAYRPLGVS